MKRIKLLTLLIFLTASQLAMANIVPTSSFPLGTIVPSGVKLFGNTFNGGTDFADAYTFSIDAPANLSGAIQITTASFWLLPRTVNLQSVSIYNQSNDLLDTDTTPDSFSFSNLIAGNYTFLVSGNATSGFGTTSYNGYLSSELSISGVPLPASGLLFLSAILGFLGLKKRSNC